MSKRQLKIDVKTQDRLREFFSKRGEKSLSTLTGISIGDSDINYDLSYKDSFQLITAAPFNVKDIKYKLISNGLASTLSGIVTLFGRRLVDNVIRSLYQYPDNISISEKDDWFLGTAVPSLTMGYEFQGKSTPLIIGDQNDLEGIILFAQALPDNYFDGFGNQERVEEGYDISVFYGVNDSMSLFNAEMEGRANNPGAFTNWIEVIKDEDNGSVCLLTTGLNYPYNIYTNYTSPTNPGQTVTHTYITVEFRGKLTGITASIILTLNNTLI